MKQILKWETYSKKKNKIEKRKKKLLFSYGNQLECLFKDIRLSISKTAPCELLILLEVFSIFLLFLWLFLHCLLCWTFIWNPWELIPHSILFYDRPNINSNVIKRDLMPTESNSRKSFVTKSKKVKICISPSLSAINFTRSVIFKEH